MTHSAREISNQIGPPLHRHAAPSAPWPWIDIEDEVDRRQLHHHLPALPSPCDHRLCNDCWKGYPQSLFPNWAPSQVRKSQIGRAIKDYRRDVPCVIHYFDLDDKGQFTDLAEHVMTESTLTESWESITKSQRPHDTRLRALFIENLSGPVLQMLGTKYHIDPFFWSSSLNWIPSRFQGETKEKVGDHITITLTFVHSVSNHDTANRSMESVHDASTSLGSQSIDTQAPLILHSNQRLLVLDLLSVHLVRNVNGSTIISYHPSTVDIPTTTARFLHERIRFAGQSVYWQSMFRESQDPTLVLLTFIWHTIYAWDEALEHLYEHICSLENRVVSTLEMPVPLIREFLIIRAHHLHYVSLLNHYTKHVIFIKNTLNPAMDGISEANRISSGKLLNRECDNLMNEIERLSSELNMQERRLKNVIELAFSAVNIADSRLMREDSAAMKQIAYLTMVFLPATFATGIFGMNVSVINPGTKGTIFQYIALTLSLTALTAWTIIAFQSKSMFPSGTSFPKRLAWPILFFQTMVWRKSTRPAPHFDYSLDDFNGHL